MEYDGICKNQKSCTYWERETLVGLARCSLEDSSLQQRGPRGTIHIREWSDLGKKGSHD
jgi:hypothetical protein